MESKVDNQKFLALYGATIITTNRLYWQYQQFAVRLAEIISGRPSNALNLDTLPMNLKDLDCFLLRRCRKCAAVTKPHLSHAMKCMELVRFNRNYLAHAVMYHYAHNGQHRLRINSLGTKNNKWKTAAPPYIETGDISYDSLKAFSTSCIKLSVYLAQIEDVVRRERLKQQHSIDLKNTKPPLPVRFQTDSRNLDKLASRDA